MDALAALRMHVVAATPGIAAGSPAVKAAEFQQPMPALAPCARQERPVQTKRRPGGRRFELEIWR
jgi:hypothetical protein